MLAKVISAGVMGVDAFTVEVEVDVSKGFPRTALVGLPDAAVKESLDRVRTAMTNSRYHFKVRRLTINLAPADLRKEGPCFELPIAAGILAATQQIDAEVLDGYAIAGELALDGRVRPIRGALPMAIHFRDPGMTGFVLPAENAHEAAVVKGIDVIPVKTLTEAVGFLTGNEPMDPASLDVRQLFEIRAQYEIDYQEVKGQEHVKRGLTVAAAGGHNALMLGPPGTGKTMLAQRLPTILPPLTMEESVETTKIYSVAGLLSAGEALLGTRPFRSPHHTVSDVALVGGGTVPRPGEVSLAHHGVLFLDELPEFNRSTLEVLRQPLEDGYVTVSRAKATVTYPSRFMLIGALNPCPCGYFTDPRRECHCTPPQIQRYHSKISGPLMDRIDIQLEVPAVEYRDLRSPVDGDTSERMLEQVLAARKIQSKRFARTAITANSQMSNRHIKKHCELSPDAEQLLSQAMQTLGLSARAYTKILKVSRTIADLDAADRIGTQHVSEAIQYRSLDRSVWA